MDPLLALPIAIVVSLAIVIGMGVVIMAGDEKRRIREEAEELAAETSAREEAEEQMQHLRDRDLV